MTGLGSEKESESSTGPHGDAFEKLSRVPECVPLTVVSPESQHVSKKLKISSHLKEEQKVDTQAKSLQGHSEVAKDNFVHPVPAAQALINPQINDADKCYLYGLRLLRASGENDTCANVQEIRNEGGLECFAVVLSRRLNGRDLSVSVGDLGLYSPIDNDVGTLRLVFLGAIKISSTQLEQIRLFMAAVFSIVIKDMSPQRFSWGKHLQNPASRSGIPCDITHLRNYLVVPVLKEQGTNERILAKSSGILPPLVQTPEEYVPVLEVIDWDRISAVIECSAGTLSKTTLEQIRFPEPGVQLAQHMATLERNLVYMAWGSRVYLAGTLHRDESPSTKIVHSKKFALEKDGSIKWDKDIEHLINVQEVPDSEDPSSYLVKTKVSSNSSTSGTQRKLGPPVTEREKEIQAVKDGKPQIFSASRNREVNRTHWVGKILTTPATLQKDWYNIEVQDLKQPMLTVMHVPDLTFDHLIRTMRGEPAKAVLASVIMNAKKNESVIPELFRVHPVPVGALFLPASLMALERHILFCELRSKIAAHVDVPVQLKLLAQAVTAEHVNPSSNYERLEILGDAFIKIASTLRIFANYPHLKEGQMHVKRSLIISNKFLMEMAKAFGLIKFLWFEIENLYEWTPPGCDREGRVVCLAPKALADVVEAICGALYLSGCEDFLHHQGNTKGKSTAVLGTQDALLSFGAIKRGYETGVRILEMFGILPGSEPSHEDVVSSALRSLRPTGYFVPTEITERAFPKDPRLLHSHQSWNDQFGCLEEAIGYRFKYRHLLLCALTHKSYADSKPDLRMMSNSFQRMEFLGDAVLDFFTILYLYVAYPALNPGQLTQLKGMVVSNETWSRVCVKFGLHNHLFLMDTKLQCLIGRFEKVVLAEIQEGDGMLHMDQAENTAAPKVLGDMFEAIIGAVLVDSGMEAAWNVSMKLLHEVLTEWANPANAVAHPTQEFEVLVMQTLRITQAHPFYEHSKSNDRNNKFQCTVKVAGEAIAVGKATSKQRAKMLAALKAHERLHNATPGSHTAKLIQELKEKARKITDEVSRNAD